MDIAVEDLFKEYWWLSVFTISVLAFAFWVFHNLATDNVIKLKAVVKRTTFFRVTLLLVVLNFGVWGVGTVALHGDAVSGKSEKNRYFLNWKGHYTEVSRGIYIYSLIHTWITIVSFPTVIVLLAITDIRRNKLSSR